MDIEIIIAIIIWVVIIFASIRSKQKENKNKLEAQINQKRQKPAYNEAFSNETPQVTRIGSIVTQQPNTISSEISPLTNNLVPAAETHPFEEGQRVTQNSPKPLMVSVSEKTDFKLKLDKQSMLQAIILGTALQPKFD